MKIEKITKLKSGKYKLQFDNDDTLLTYDEVILENNLLQHKEIDYDLFHKLKVDNDYYDVYNRVVKYISTKMRSKKEISNYLKKFNLKKEDQQKIIDRLINIGLINDENFTKSFINDRFNLSKDGPLVIKKSLQNHDINEEVIDKYLSKIENQVIIDKIDKIVLKKIKANNRYSNYVLKQKLIKELNNLGFDYETSLERIDKLLGKNSVALEREFEKCYQKYHNKLNDTELKYKIKRVLYQKGFEIDEINDLFCQKNLL